MENIETLKIHGKRLLLEPDKAPKKMGNIVWVEKQHNPGRHVEPYFIRKIGNPDSPFKEGQKIVIPTGLGTMWEVFDKEYRFIDECDVFGYFPCESNLKVEE